MEGVICWYARTEDLQLARSVWESHAATVRGPIDVRLSATHALCQNGYSQTPILFVQVPQLPKGALVEWQFAVHTGRRVTPVIHDDEELPVTHEYKNCGQSGQAAIFSELTRASRPGRGISWSDD